MSHDNTATFFCLQDGPVNPNREGHVPRSKTERALQVRANIPVDQEACRLSCPGLR